jgi:SAM-dependent methyltransferase
MSKRQDYVKEYFDKNYASGRTDKEVKVVGKFLAENVKGKALDCGCGPVPQIWAICMPKVKEIYAIDLPKESIKFVKKELKQRKKYSREFKSYKEIAEKIVGKLPKDYIINQINKIKSVKQADMSKKIPFDDNSFDIVMSIFSLGCLKNVKELKKAIKEISRVLKKGGKFLHINTNGKNSNEDLPEYTWRGLPQMSEILIPYLKKAGFSEVKLRKIKLNHNSSSYYSMYKYNQISLLSAIKK